MEELITDGPVAEREGEEREGEGRETERGRREDSTASEVEKGNGVVLDSLQGLPELPRSRHTLPPIKGRNENSHPT